LYGRTVISFTTFILLSTLLSPIQAIEVREPWIEVGKKASYEANVNLPDFGVRQKTTYSWEIISETVTPQGDGATFYVTIADVADYYDVPHATGFSIIYLPRSQLGGALKTELRLPMGNVPVVKRIVDWQGIRGEVYYDERSCVAVRGDLAGIIDNREYSFTFEIRSASSGIVNPARETPIVTSTPTPKETVMGLDPMMFYTLIIVLAIFVVGGAVILSLRRRPPRYLPPPPTR